MSVLALALHGQILACFLHSSQVLAPATWDLSGSLRAWTGPGFLLPVPPWSLASSFLAEKAHVTTRVSVVASGTQWVVLPNSCQVDPTCPPWNAPSSWPLDEAPHPQLLHHSNPGHHVLPQLPPGTLQYSARSLAPKTPCDEAWFDSP